MDFNRHSGLKDKHALLSPSKAYWINYSEDKLEHFVQSHIASVIGSKQHAYAAMAIELGNLQPRNNKTINSYINDAIGFRMKPEQPLVWSEYCFGTADAISFRKGLLRIHDLKTGKSHVSDRQLLVYMALFCLEYEMKPAEIQAELRYYQSDEIFVIIPDPDEITHIMDRIVTTERRLRQIREEALA